MVWAVPSVSTPADEPSRQKFEKLKSTCRREVNLDILVEGVGERRDRPRFDVLSVGVVREMQDPQSANHGMSTFYLLELLHKLVKGPRKMAPPRLA